jgi:F-type H+-transporting ATPase subunit b
LLEREGNTVPFDWFTFGAQLVNFLILLLLLRRFLFTPIQRAIRRREESIRARYQEAAAKLLEATEESEQWRAQQHAFERERAERIAAVEAEAATLHKQMVQAARTEVATLQDRWHAALAHEQGEFLQSLRHRIGEQIVTIAQRALRDLADRELERQIFVVFLQQLRRLPEGERAQLRQVVHATKDAVTIRSTFALRPEEQHALLELLHELTGETVALQFKEAPDLLCGIEVQVYGQRIAWSLNHYLAEVEDHLSGLVKSDVASYAPTELPHQNAILLEKKAPA